DLPAALVELERSMELLRELLESDRANVSDRRNYAQNLLYLSALHARMSAETAGAAPEREKHRRKSTTYYERGREVLQALRAEGPALAADEDLLEDVQAQLGLPNAFDRRR
nr:hypothetical protein [Gammaproteobacteria bacterium]